MDGLSGRESLLTPFFFQLAPHVELVGGSIATESFEHGDIVHHGRIYRDAAAFTLLEYPRPFSTFHITHHLLLPTLDDGDGCP